MAEKYFEGKVPKTDVEDNLTKEVAKILGNGYGLSIENMQFHKTSEILQQAITLINQQIEQDAPWKLAKTDTKKLADCMYCYFQATDLIALHLIPFMPTLSEKIWQLNGGNGNIVETAKKYFEDKVLPKEGFSPSDTKLGKFEILFPRIQTEA
jgi:methionyl-tRNA synthetase